jgi:hypothetical protein
MTTSAWYGWFKRRGWIRATGPHPTLAEAALALEQELRRRGIKRQRPRNQRLVFGAGRPRDASDQESRP